MPSTISPMVWPAARTRSVPMATLAPEASIRVLISLAAAALRCARLRTSAATTAKPRPCSPARAASTAALSARMLVWKAMASMTPMISPILDEALEMSSMVLTALPTTSPPLVAELLADWARRVAMAAASADWRTLAVSCDSEAEVSCRLLAEDSVRLDRSRLPSLISSVAVFMDSTPLRTSLSTVPICSTKPLKDEAICATSSLPDTGRRCVRSPPPEPILSMASRTCDRRRKDWAVSAAATAVARQASSTMAMASVLSTLCRPVVASALSSATTSSQSVPCTGRALSSLALPPRFTSSGAVALASAVSAAGVSSSERSEVGLSSSLASACASTWPSRLTTKPRLPGVGRMAETTSRTPSSGTAPLITPCSAPPRSMGATKAT